MTDRIKAIALQASLYADRVTMEVEELPAGETWSSIRDAKFAEFLVQECMNQCEDMDDRYRIGIHFSI
jgi:hypothetical protein